MFYSVTCKKADCGKRFKIRGPLKAGVYKVGCPFCRKEMNVKIAGDPKAAGEQKPAQRSAQASAPADIIKKYKSKLAALQSAYAKKQTQLKETYQKKRAALKAAFDAQCSANEAEYAKSKAALEAEMKAAISAAEAAAQKGKAEQKAKEQAKKHDAAVKPNQLDFSAAPIKDLGQNIETGKEGLMSVCPHCGQKIGLPKQETAGKKKIICPKCKGPIAITVTKPHIPTFRWSDMDNLPNILGKRQQSPQPAAYVPSNQKPQPGGTTPKNKVEKPYLLAHHKESGRPLRFVPDECGRPFGSLAGNVSGQSTERAYLKTGANTIGRYDAMTPSDIGIDGRYDSRMSRCSTCIEVTPTPQGYRFTAILKNSKNPVLCNGMMMAANKSYPITYGASLIMGETIFTLMSDK